MAVVRERLSSSPPIERVSRQARRCVSAHRSGHDRPHVICVGQRSCLGELETALRMPVTCSTAATPEIAVLVSGEIMRQRSLFRDQIAWNDHVLRFLPDGPPAISGSPDGTRSPRPHLDPADLASLRFVNRPKGTPARTLLKNADVQGLMPGDQGYGHEIRNA